MSAMSFWGMEIKPGKTGTALRRDLPDASIVLKQVRRPERTACENRRQDGMSGPR
jgi:hypothetical protein